MKYLIRYYIDGDKTRFLEAEYDLDDSLSCVIAGFEASHPKAIIQKIQKQ